MPVEFLISALVTLLVVVDPLGLVPAFLAVTDGLSAAARRRIALRACLIAGAIPIGSALAGDWLSTAFRTHVDIVEHGGVHLWRPAIAAPDLKG